jgi:dihydroorotate dehydrogenase electron transfer subunit
VATCEVIFNRPINDCYRHMAVMPPAEVRSAMMAARPGQFFQLLCPGHGTGDHVLRRPMSLYGLDHAQGRVEFLYKVIGVGTHGLATLARGDQLDLFGPLGRGFRLAPEWRHIVLLGRGAGVATLVPLAVTAAAQRTRVTAVVSAADPAQLVSVGQLRSAGAGIVAVTDSDGSAAPERIETLLRRLVTIAGCSMIATCGSSRLLQLVQRLCGELGVAGQVAIEQQMACGIGSCFCCVRPFHVRGRVEVRRVCIDGPVFDVLEVPV